MDVFPEEFAKTKAPKADLAQVSELLMTVWRDYLAHARTYLKLSALPLLSFPFLAIGLSMTIVGVASDGSIVSANPENPLLYVAVMSVGVIIIAVANVLGQAALNISIAGGGKDVPIVALRNARPVFWKFAATLVLSTIIVSLGFSILFVPGVIFGAFLVFAEPATALDKLGPIAAIKLSVRMTTGRFWAVLWRVAVGYAIIAATSLALSFPLVQIPTTIIGRVLANNLLGLRLGLAVTMLIGAVITAVILPLFVSLQVHLFNEVKKKNPS